MRGWELRLAESRVTSGELLLRGEENVTVRAKVTIVSVVVGVASLELATRSSTAENLGVLHRVADCPRGRVKP